MKERITIEQLNELSDDEKKLLQTWWEPKQYDVIYWIDDGQTAIIKYELEKSLVKGIQNFSLPLLSVGQMMFMLQEHDKAFKWWYMDNYTGGIKELCNELWDDLKQTLKKTIMYK